MPIKFFNFLKMYRIFVIFKSNLFLFYWYFNFFKNSFLYFTKKKVKHFETKFASTDFKVNLLNLKKIFLEKNRFFKKLIRNFNLPFIRVFRISDYFLHFFIPRTF